MVESICDDLKKFLPYFGFYCWTKRWVVPQYVSNSIFIIVVGFRCRSGYILIYSHIHCLIVLLGMVVWWC